MGLSRRNRLNDNQDNDVLPLIFYQATTKISYLLSFYLILVVQIVYHHPSKVFFFLSFFLPHSNFGYSHIQKYVSDRLFLYRYYLEYSKNVLRISITGIFKITFFTNYHYYLFELF